MSPTRGHTLRAEISTTPLVGVLLVLLVTFMITAPNTAAHPVDMPPASPPPCSCMPGPPPTLVTVLDARSAFVRPAGWSEDGFAVDLSDNAAWTRPARVEERVFIRAEADVAYGDVIEVMNGLRRRGFTLISVVNEDLDKPASTSAG